MAIPDRLKAEISQRAQNCCEYCKSQAMFCPDAFSVEHILPESKGGETVPENLGLSCQGCNNTKYNFTTGKDPLTDQEVPLYHPRQDVWESHFLWSADGLEIIGITPKGRATVERLRLNRENVKGWRQLAIAFGIHPPTPASETEE